MKDYLKRVEILKLSHINFIAAFMLPFFVSAQIEFTKKTGNDNPLYNADVGSGVSSISVDIDNDGDFDLFVGNASGTIQYFKNISTVENPNVFEEQENGANPFNGVDVGESSIPVFVDIDNNSTLDCFIGSTNAIHYYKNTGSISNPVFVEQLSNANPLVSVTSSGSRSYMPSFVDIDGDSDIDCFLGYVDFDIEDSQGILFYKNEGSNSLANFVIQNGNDNPFQSFNELYPQPIFLDFDLDHDYDVFIGKGNGDFDFYENTTEAVELSVDKDKIEGLKMYPNPASNIVNFDIRNKEYEVRVISLNGFEVYNGILSEQNSNIDVRNIASGIYIVILDNGKTKITQKLVVNK